MSKNQQLNYNLQWWILKTPMKTKWNLKNSKKLKRTQGNPKEPTKALTLKNLEEPFGLRGNLKKLKEPYGTQKHLKQSKMFHSIFPTKVDPKHNPC